MKLVMIFGFCLLVIGTGAVTIYVPEDYATIQEAIDIAIDNDRVMVSPGVYYENINYDGKSIEVCSWYSVAHDTSYISQTVIDGGQDNSVVRMSNYQSSVILCGFTIQNGMASNGGGVKVSNCEAELEGLIIKNNNAIDDGGGIYCYSNNDIIMTDMVVRNNASGDNGGGIYNYGSRLSMTNLEINDNVCERDGGGVYLNSSSNAVWQNVRIHDNEAENNGGGIAMNSISYDFQNLRIYANSASQGGGVYIDLTSNPDFEQVKIYGNSAWQGGGMYIKESIPHFMWVQVRNNAAEFGGGIYMQDSEPEFDFYNRSSVYLNRITERGCGVDMYSENHVVVYLDTCTVMYPTDYHISPRNNFTINVWHFMRFQVAADLYVAIDGDNSNCGQIPSDPLRTIEFANSIILADAENPRIIHLAEGIYSPSTNGEQFPVCLADYVHLAGESAESVILDAEESAGCIKLRDVKGAVISGMTLMNGDAERGGAIYIYHSDVSMEDIKMINNRASWLGGAIYLKNIAQLELESVYISDNYSNYLGGGIYTDLSEIGLSNVIIKDNYANRGGGIYTSHSQLALNSVSLHHNRALVEGGGMYITWDTELDMDEQDRSSIYMNWVGERGLGNDIYSTTTCIHVVVDTFSVINPTSYYLSPFDHFYWDIQHGLVQPIASDLYVSATGDDNNAGTSWQRAFKTIEHACSVILANSVNPRTIHLANGLYSTSVTGESMPLCLPDYVTLSGESESGVILDGENSHRVFRCVDDSSTIIKNLTVRRGYGYTGGGIYIRYSGVTFEDITVQNCHATYSGGGICVENDATPSFRNLTVENNIADFHGGGISCGYYSSSVFENLIVRGNSAENGGGIHCISQDNVLIDTFMIEDNLALEDGGGIYNRGIIELSNGIIRNNYSASHGGGLLCDFEEYGILKNVKIENNSAGGNGGGIYSDCDSINVSYCLIAFNISQNCGGGMYIKDVQAADIINTTIYGNTASNSGGGIYYQDIEGSIIINSIIWNDEPSEIYCTGDDYPADLVISYSDIRDIENNIIIEDEANVILLEGNIEQNPLFNNIMQGNYLLSPDSPCIDAGTAYFEYEGEVLVDLEEDEYWGEAPDMGAFEYGMVETDEVVIENEKLKIENYPNPFNPETQIVFNLPETGIVKLTVYNLKGQLVKNIADEDLPAGENRFIWDGRNEMGRLVSSGVYLVRLQSENESVMKKIMLIK